MSILPHIHTSDATITPTPNKTPIANASGSLTSWVDTSNLENTIAIMAWDTYNADYSFDDIYTDNFQPSSNSTLTATITTSQIDCYDWEALSSIVVNQTTPGDVTVSKVYHAVSFDGGVTYKIYIDSTWVSICRNNGGTWQYLDDGSWTNSTTNSLTTATTGALAMATAQTAYQWTKSLIEDMTVTHWGASDGWSTSITTIDWAHVIVNGLSVTGYGSTYATPIMTSNTTPSGVASASYEYSSDFAAWTSFSQGTLAYVWGSGSSFPAWLKYEFDTATIINSFKANQRQ